jgi:alpha-L-fucosidase 2
MQVDGAFGFAAALAELILQSHEDEISLLPALPAAWTEGEAAGLLARGGFEISLRWQGGRLAEASLLSKLGRVCRVRTPSPAEATEAGKIVRTTRSEPGVIEFPTEPGKIYVVKLTDQGVRRP